MRWFIVVAILGALLTFIQPVDSEAAGADPYLSEITLFSGKFAPKGYAFCDGQKLPISKNQALFALIGLTYGGNFPTDFALPDLRTLEPQLKGPRYIIAVKGLFPVSD